MGAILHTTNILALGKILTSGVINPYYPDADENHQSTQGVYTIYIFKNMAYDGKYWYYGSNIPSTSQIIIVLKPEIFKKIKFIVCPGINYGNCIHYPKDCIMTNNTTKNKTTLQITTQLETYINKQLKAVNDNFLSKKNKPNVWDVLTHEVVFLESIDIKYIDAIITAPSILKKVTTYISKLKEQKKISNVLNFRIIRRPNETQWKELLFT